jgi:glycosyltransferase involved in cell wall biosynthesis
MSVPTLNQQAEKIKVAFLIRSLDFGGAQRQIVNLAKALDRKSFDITVISFYQGGIFAKELDERGIRRVCLDKSGRWDLFSFARRLVRELRDLKPAVLLSYLDIPNILAVLSKRVSPATKIVWGVRISELELGNYDWLTAAAFTVERKLARFADLVIANSTAGHERALTKGFPAARVVTIPNGVDTEIFTPDAAARSSLRALWGVPDHMKLIGIVGRLDPVKDHATFLRAAQLLSESRDDVRFISVGDGPPHYVDKLKELANELSLTDRLLWSNARDDAPAVLNSLDVLVSSSTSEGFPNVVAEAMACGVPCVVTDAGDSAQIVGDTGMVVPRRDPPALAAALKELVANTNEETQTRTRERVVQNFGLDQLALLTERHLLSLLDSKADPRF